MLGGGLKRSSQTSSLFEAALRKFAAGGLEGREEKKLKRKGQRRKRLKERGMKRK